MPSASFLFSAVFRFRKPTQEIFSELHGTKTQVIFPVMYTETEGDTEGSHEAPKPPGGAGPTPGTRGGGVGPTGLSWGQPFAHKYLVDGKP